MSEINISYSKNEYLWELVNDSNLPAGSKEENKQKMDELHELTNKHSQSQSIKIINSCRNSLQLM